VISDARLKISAMGARFAGANLAWGAAAALVVAASFAVSPDAHGFIGAALGLLMLGVAESDARRFVAPDAYTVPAFALGLVDAGLMDGAAGLETAVLGAAFAAGAFYALRWLYRRLRGCEGLGLGDVKLAAVAGAWLGASAAPIAIELAALAAIAAYLARQWRKGQALRSTARLPFGAFFAPAIWIVCMFEAWLPPL
jgi:leader peptidase (prepilin peptidase)/N-methyltransferase